MKVLVVDDSAVVRERLVEVLSALQGVEHVDTAARASDARRAIQSARPDVVLLDIHMPGGSGIEVLEALRADNRRILTIVLTNDPAPQWRAASFRAGADFFFDKSREFQQAIDVIAHLALGHAGPGGQAGPVARENEEAQRQSGILNRSLLDYLPHRIFVKDRQSRYLFCNANYALDLGIEPQQIVGEDDFAFFPAELAERYRADDRSVMADGKIKILDEPYTVAGEEQWVHTIKVPYRTEQGEIIGVLGLFEDIPERRRAEELLRLEGAALNAAADAIIITDSAGVIEWVNQAFTQLTGYTAEEAIGRNPRDLVKSGKHSQAFYQEFWETILAGRTWHGEMINRRKDGSLYSEDQTVTPIRNASGAITHFVAIKEDVTERLQLEAQYRQAQRMESVGLLASGIAHDFNNLLTVINGMAELVLEQVSKDIPMYADVQEIHRAGLRAAALTRQLSAFSRQQALEPRVMNLNTVVAGMESLLRRLLGEDIDLVAVLSPQECSVRADPGQIEQVITNLAVNARDAMPQGGRLTIETQKVTIDNGRGHEHPETVPPGSYVQLSVSDSGIGMDEATRARIFEPFFTTKGPGKGTGLGLSTVYGIVKQSQGFVWVHSEVKQGTTFKIYLPQVQMIEAAGIDRREPAVVPGSGNETILLVEDTAALRNLAKRVLEPAGYTVFSAATGEEALRLLERHRAPVHLLLTDLVMPGMSGQQLGQWLAQTRPEIKVLYMSGYASDTAVRGGVVDAHGAFLNKPFTAAALLRRVREVLDS